MYYIISNNPMVRDKYTKTAEFHQTGAMGLLVIVRDKVHRGAIILSHPLSGGALPVMSPYRSIIIAESDESGAVSTDFESLHLIESALKMQKSPTVGFEGYDAKTLEDFQVLDLDIIDSALMGLVGTKLPD